MNSSNNLHPHLQYMVVIPLFPSPSQASANGFNSPRMQPIYHSKPHITLKPSHYSRLLPSSFNKQKEKLKKCNPLNPTQHKSNNPAKASSLYYAQKPWKSYSATFHAPSPNRPRLFTHAGASPRPRPLSPRPRSWIVISARLLRSHGKTRVLI
jgi:hypothetical protein